MIKGKNKTQEEIFKKKQIKMNKTKIIREYRQHIFYWNWPQKKELLVIVLKESYSKSKGNVLLQKSLQLSWNLMYMYFSNEII